jgi:hypothetical protein
LQFSQAPFELKLKSPASTSLAAASSLRKSSITPVYVAGVERLEAPTADWSMTMALECAGTNARCISELLPEPATPVTTVSTPLGMSTFTLCRLLKLAFRIGSGAPRLRGLALIGTSRSRYWPVRVVAWRSST